MTNIFRRTIPKLSLSLLLILGLISLAVPNAAAFENPTTNNNPAEARSTEPANAKPAPSSNTATAVVAPPTITYIVYNEAMKQPLESDAPVLPTLAVSFKTINVAGSATKDMVPAPLPPRSIPAVSTAPMTPGC